MYALPLYDFPSYQVGEERKLWQRKYVVVVVAVVLSIYGQKIFSRENSFRDGGPPWSVSREMKFHPLTIFSDKPNKTTIHITHIL